MYGGLGRSGALGGMTPPPLPMKGRGGGVYGFLDGNRGFFWGYAVREAGDYAFLSYLCLQPLQVMVTRPVPLGTQAMRRHLGQRK